MTLKTQQDIVKKIRDGMNSARSIVDNIQKVNGNSKSNGSQNNPSATERANSIGSLISTIMSIAG